jgi:putative ABC transport system permease protein
MSNWWKSRRARNRDLELEMRAHLEMATHDRIARGETPDDAARNARRDFGDATTVREVTSDMWSGEWMHQLTQDVRYAVRGLARAPGFALVSVLTLALGIGANTAIFSVVNGVLLRPLAYRRPEQLVVVTSQFAKLNLDQFPVDAGEYIEFRARTRAFQDVGAYTAGAVNVGTDDAAQRVVSGTASPSLFSTLGVPALRGHTFTEQEAAPGGPLVVVVSQELWESAFGGRPIVGTEILVDGAKRTVTGVMPRGFDIRDEGIRIWFPLRLDAANPAQYRGGHYLAMIGRLKDGVSLGAARSDLETMLAQWVVIDGGTDGAKPSAPGFVHAPNKTTHRLRFDDLQADMVGGIGRALWVLQAAVVFVLIIACANLANLLLMRAESRHRELAVRAALGAGRGRLIRQFLSESLVLSLVGATAGVVLARVGLKVLVLAGSAGLPRTTSIAIDGRVLAFTLVLAVLSGLIFGMAPLMHLSASNVGLALRDGGSRSTTTGARNRVRRGLVVGEVALAVTLVIGAGLLLRSFWNLMRVDAGFDRSNLTSFSIALPPRVYTDSTRRVAFYDNLTRQLTATPGVTSVAAMTGLPPQRNIDANDVTYEGYTAPADAPPTNAEFYQIVTANYFTTMRIPIVSGRGFGRGDDAKSQPVAIINETLARQYYPNQNPIGRRLQQTGSATFFTIVGVAKDVKQGGVAAKIGTELYFLYEQTPSTAFGYAPTAMNVVVRSTLDKSALSPAIHRVVSALDAGLPVVGYRSMDEVISDSVARPRFLAQLLGVFATVALLLSAIGTYGVLAFAVMERRREIGIRMALGATANGVLAMVLRQGLTLAAAGLVIGLLGAAALTRLTTTLLFGVTPLDPPTFVAVGAFMLLVAAAAAVIPARRATRVDPLTALRSD